MMLRAIPSLFCLVCGSLAFVGCGDDSSDGAGGAGGEAADCQAISDVCHDVDELSDAAHDCHELAHANDAAACAPEKDACIELCSALAAGGAGGHGGEHDH